MITTTGTQALQRTVAGLQPGWATHIALGIGITAATAADSRLAHEILRVPVTFSSVDYTNNTVIFKATIPADVALSVYEMGLVNNALGPVSLLTNFSEDSTVWSAGSSSTSNVRVGTNTLLLAPAASATVSATGAFDIDLSRADEVLVSYFVGSNVSSIALQLRTDASNYYSYALPTTAGYNTVRIPKASLSTTGTPSAISAIYVSATATAGGTANVFFDSLSTSENTSRDPELVARRVLGAAFTKPSGVPYDVEYTVGVA